MSLDHEYTCKYFDRAYSGFVNDSDDLKSYIESELSIEVSKIVNTNNLDEDLFSDLISNIVYELERKIDNLQHSVSNSIEGCRASNVAMRSSADDQIDSLNDTIKELEASLSSANDKISDLENEVEDMMERLQSVD